MAPDRPTDERGVALVVALLALVALTVLAAGGLWVARATFQSSEAFETSHRAFYAADAALQEFLGTHGVDPPADTTFGFGNGEEATVTALQVRRDPDVYRIESTGRVVLDGDTVSTRTVGVTATVSMGPMPSPPSVMYAPNGIEKNGGSGTISGMDAFSGAAGGGDGTSEYTGYCQGRASDDVSGVVVPPGGYEQNGGDLVPDGSPHDTLSMAQGQMLDTLDLEWQAVVDGEAVNFDHVVTPGNLSGWPDFGQSSSGDWPVIYVGGAPGNTVSLNSTHSGHGVLIVRGDLSMSGNFSWDGLVYVGGELTAASGNTSVDGAMISSLNLLLGESVGDAATLNGTPDFRFNSCVAHLARSSMSRLEIVPGTWYQGGGES